MSKSWSQCGLMKSLTFGLTLVNEIWSIPVHKPAIIRYNTTIYCLIMESLNLFINDSFTTRREETWIVLEKMDFMVSLHM